jgi:hypothetical protein
LLGQSSCPACPSGRYTDLSFASECLLCQAGKASEFSTLSTQCLNCSAGTYHNAPGLTGACPSCPGGSLHILSVCFYTLFLNLFLRVPFQANILILALLIAWIVLWVVQAQALALIAILGSIKTNLAKLFVSIVLLDIFQPTLRKLSFFLGPTRSF